jgi:predicted nucleic acid-binding protein
VIVADASAVGDFLLDFPNAAAIRAVLAEHSTIHVPEHFHIEVISMLRRRALRGELDEPRRAQALSDLCELRVVRYAATELLPRAWELRERLSAYDAAYLALAHELDLTLITCDAALAGVARAEGRLVELG